MEKTSDYTKLQYVLQKGMIVLGEICNLSIVHHARMFQKESR